MLTHYIRRLVARLGIAALLFAQLMVTVHACPVVSVADDTMRAAMSVEQHDAMPCCDEPDSGNVNANLCVQHCLSGSQSVQAAPQVPPAAFMLVPVAVVATSHYDCDHNTVALPAPPERRTSPPPLERFCVLRI